MTDDEALTRAFNVLFDALDNHRLSLQGLTPLTVLKLVKEYADCIKKVHDQGRLSVVKSLAQPAPHIDWKVESHPGLSASA